MNEIKTKQLRDDDGLLIGVNHPRKSDGTIDWRAMVRPSDLFVNPDYETELCTQFNVKSRREIDVTKCEDKQLLITLAGLKYLCRLRGLISIRPSDLHVTPESVTSVCTLEFTPNFENPDGLIVGAQASASLYSVSGKFQLYLAAFAQNRAFVRAAKDALGIEILGYEEVDFKASKAYEAALKEGKTPLVATPVPSEPETPALTSFDGPALLAQLCAKLNKKGSHSFEKIKAHAVTIAAELKSDPATWISFDSIPRLDSFTLMSKIQEAAEKKK